MISPDDAARVLDLLASRFGATGAELWGLYWHATLVYAATYMLTSVGFGVVCLAASQRITIEDEDFQWVRPALMILSGAIIALGVASNLTDLVMPQAAALHSLLGK